MCVFKSPHTPGTVEMAEASWIKAAMEVEIGRDLAKHVEDVMRSHPEAKRMAEEASEKVWGILVERLGDEAPLALGLIVDGVCTAAEFLGVPWDAALVALISITHTMNGKPKVEGGIFIQAMMRANVMLRSAGRKIPIIVGIAENALSELRKSLKLNEKREVMFQTLIHAVATMMSRHARSSKSWGEAILTILHLAYIAREQREAAWRRRDEIGVRYL